MNTDLPYHRYHIALLMSLFDTLRAQSVLMAQVPEESNVLFLERFEELVTQLQAGDQDALYAGQEIICQIITRYPQVAHMIPRDLLWYFGGDCLHYMPDEEIAQYQLLDEHQAQAEARGEEFDWEQARLLLMSEHLRNS
ncbi:PA2817 family protein [Halopseudomonas bauzanensis]|uniref:PA2817 family protein n=1 Tax=Halopseudomonas bauzanensis TaxID=653930 RepID=UPI002556DEE4|nr:PA2817 family protein [Halopseudomonas bauzanensis]